jgi:tetratricopeptide (TPR) repeat protein
MQTGKRTWPAGLVLILMMVGGCQKSVSQEGLSQLAEARRQFEAAQYEKAEEGLSRFLEERRGRDEAAAAHYLRGLCYRQAEPAKNDLAERDFERAIELTADVKVRQLAQAALGHVRFEKQDYAEAIEHYSAALAEPMAEDSGTDAVLYRLGVSLQNVGRWDEADAHLSRCLGEFARSAYAGPSQRRFGARSFCVQLGAFANLDGAVRRVEQLERQGVKAGWSATRGDGKLKYVVRTGRYDSLSEAEAALRSLASAQTDAFVTVEK